MIHTSTTQGGPGFLDSSPNGLYVETEPLVLLVEDDSELRALLSDGLSASGYDVVSMGDGTDALKYLELSASSPEAVRAPEAIITDALMPNTTGLQLLEQVRLVDWYTPVIVISAFADDEMRAESRRLGALVLAKPFEMEELAEQLAALVETPL